MDLNITDEKLGLLGELYKQHSDARPTDTISDSVSDSTNPIDLLNSICYLCLLFYILVRSEKLAANKPYISCLLKKIKNKLPQNELDFFEEFYLFYENVFNK